MTTYSQRMAQGKRSQRDADRHLREIVAEQHAERLAEAQARAERHKAEREAEQARVRLTADDVKGATHVRDRIGWHRVVRVSAKSVTVATPYSWTDRIPLDRILQAARMDEETRP